MEIIDQTNRENVLYFFVIMLFLLLHFLLFGFSGGILGWDPVHTTCITGEMMMML